MPPLLLAVALFLTGGMPWLVWGFCLPTMTLAHATFAINTVNHMFGSRRFDTDRRVAQQSVDRVVRGGRGLAQQPPSLSARRANGFYWWEYDPTWYVIRLMQLVGLAWDVKAVPERIYEEARAAKARRGTADGGQRRGDVADWSGTGRRRRLTPVSTVISCAGTSGFRHSAAIGAAVNAPVAAGLALRSAASSRACAQPHPRVEPGPRHELIVGAISAIRPAFITTMQSASRTVDRRCAMTRLVRREAAASAPPGPSLGSRVERTRGFVQNQDPRILQNRARDREPLTFARRER